MQRFGEKYRGYSRGDSRFTVTRLEGQLQVRIVDQETGRSQLVPLFAYRVVREVLSGFFGEVVDG